MPYKLHTNFIFSIYGKLDYFHDYFICAKMGNIGPILDIFFICIKINGNIIAREIIDVITMMHHHGKPTNEFMLKIASRIVWIIGFNGWKIHGIYDRYLASKSINLNYRIVQRVTYKSLIFLRYEEMWTTSKYNRIA